jgi:hypothetical protein
MAAYSPEYGHMSSRHCMKITRANPDGTIHDTLVLATIVLGYMALQLNIAVLPNGSLGVPQRRPSPHNRFTETWPRVDRRNWPPPEMLDSTTIDAFAMPRTT